MEKYFVAAVIFLAAWLCLAVEAFIIPGFGVVGVLGFLLLGGAIIYTWVFFGAVWGIGSLILSFVLCLAGLWLVTRTKLGRRFVLSTSHKGTASSIGHDNAGLVGKEGVLLSDLHPIGSALVEGIKVDVITKGVYLKKGCRVRVIETSGPSLIVEEVSSKQ